MILSIGEILIDAFPGYNRIGGAPFNYAAHLKNFNFPVRIISRIGIDENAEIVKKYLIRNKYDLKDIQIDNLKQTGKVLIDIDKKGIPGYRILPDAAYDFISYEDISFPDEEEIKIIYVGSLIQRTSHGHALIQNLLKKRNESTKCIFDINLRKDCINNNAIIDTLKHADILKLNSEELKYIINLVCSNKNKSLFSENDFIKVLMENFSIEIIALTKGEEGSSIFTKTNSHTFSAKYSPVIIDTVGAGDAFASAMTIGFLKGWNPEMINIFASDFASAICGIPGAIPEDKEIYTTFNKKYFIE